MKLYNTLTRSVDAVEPLRSGAISLYTCGLTVYSQPHIGNWVAYIYWDILVRSLKAEGYDVTHVQNITDVGHLTDDGDAGEDKMQKGALREGKTAWDIAKKYGDIADHEAYDMLGLLRPTHMPKATDYISQQIEYVSRLESAGFTYVIDDGVYFDTTKLTDYGKLARLDISGLRFGARVADTGKKNPTDFAVWKFSDPEEHRDMEWDSPWGKGFPGWHLECSVMAMELLGERIDIHAGGIDHIPVHHTNEIAQTEALTHAPFANSWVHVNHLKVDGTKISKSLGNVYTLDDLVRRGYDLNAFKLFVASKHYRSEGNFDWTVLDAAQARFDRWRSIVVLRHQTFATAASADVSSKLHETRREVAASLSNDLDTVTALTQLDQLFSLVEKAPLNELQSSTLTDIAALVSGALGIDILSTTPDISDEDKTLVKEREEARAQKNWQRSDELRDMLAERGIGLNDTAAGTTWYYIQ